MPGDAGVLVVTRVRSTNTKCTRGRGCSGRPAFPTPSLGREINARLGRSAPRDLNACLEIVIASEAKQSILSLRGEMDCFAPLAMTAPGAHSRDPLARNDEAVVWKWSRSQCEALATLAPRNPLVMPGLDPGSHPSSQRSCFEEDGSPGHQARWRFHGAGGTRTSPVRFVFARQPA